MPQVQIRPVVTADIPALMQIDHQGKSEYVWQMDRVIEDNQVSINFREVRLPRSVRVEYPHAIDWSGEKLLSQGGLLVAILENELAGYIRLDDRYIPQTAWVRDLAVGVVFRRQGVASVLMIAAHEWAQQRKLRRMTLETHSKNYPAIRMALKLGFEFSGFHDQYYASQDIAIFFSRLIR